MHKAYQTNFVSEKKNKTIDHLGNAGMGRDKF